MPLDIPLPTASVDDDPVQYIPLLLSAVEGFLLARDVWSIEDYPQAYQYMQQLMGYIVNCFGLGCGEVAQVGEINMWLAGDIPPQWLPLEGGAAYISQYPQLFALWGYTYGNLGEQFGLPDFRGYSPMGIGSGFISLNQAKGSLTHSLTVNEIPPHTHIVPKNTATAGSTLAAVPSPRVIDTSAPHLETTATGGGAAHNNVHPVRGVRFIVYAGEA